MNHKRNEISGNRFGTKTNRATRSDKKVRVMLSLPQEEEAKLKRLAISCDMAKSTLGNEIVTWALNNSDFLELFQRRYNISDELRVIPIKRNGKLIY